MPRWNFAPPSSKATLHQRSGHALPKPMGSSQTSPSSRNPREILPRNLSFCSWRRSAQRTSSWSPSNPERCSKELPGVGPPTACGKRDRSELCPHAPSCVVPSTTPGTRSKPFLCLLAPDQFETFPHGIAYSCALMGPLAPYHFETFPLVT